MLQSKIILKLEEIGTLRGCEGIWLDGHEPSNHYNRLTVTLSTKTPTNSYKTLSYSIHTIKLYQTGSFRRFDCLSV